MTANSCPPLSEFEVWLLCRIAQAVEACEVSEALLREVLDAFGTRDLMFLAGQRDLAVRRLEGLRDRFVCWLAEGWLDGRRREYGKGRTARLGEV
jgi:hypothetical protein